MTAPSQPVRAHRDAVGPLTPILETRHPRALAPRPATLAETGLPTQLIADLALKTLLQAGVLRNSALCDRLALPGSVMESVLQLLRKDGSVEVRTRPIGENELYFGLTQRGHTAALDAFARSGYVGAAPVPLEQYSELVRRQTVHSRAVTRESMTAAFEGIVLSEGQRDRLGAALNSGRAIFIYGHAGTGKSYVARRLERALPGTVLVPFALSVGDTIVEVFDPASHMRVQLLDSGSPLALQGGFDARYALCERPIVVTAGELTSEMLEVRLDSATRRYSAPVQLRANNGILIVDDLGRQRIPVEALLNRWIVPLEEKIDYLTAANGAHFEVPFDVVLVLATNLDPAELADDAFLRRIGYKIEFTPLATEEYHRIWMQVCQDRRVAYEPDVVDHVIRSLHVPSGTPLLACHPRDLVDMALDRATYLGLPRTRIDASAMDWAWRNYFVNAAAPEPTTDSERGETPQPR
jgi:MoxR-like ATPase